MEIQEKPARSPKEAVELQGAEVFARPPSSDLKMAIVCPIYAEYNNSNLFWVLEKFSKQTAKPNNFELIFVVNNTTKEVQEKSPQFKENQQSLRVLKWLVMEGKEDVSEIERNEERQRVLTEAREKGLKLAVIDLSSKGVPETNIGALRDLGTSLAINRFNHLEVAAQDAGIVAQFDADTLVSRRFVERVVNFFTSHQNIEALFPKIETAFAGGEERLAKLHPFFEFRWLKDRLYSFLTRFQPKSSSQIIARVAAMKKVKGVPHFDFGEDYALAERLNRKCQVIYEPKITVFSALRARKESFEGAGFAEELNSLKKGLEEYERYSKNLVLRILGKLTDELPSSPAEFLVKEEFYNHPLTIFLRRELRHYIGDSVEGCDFSEIRRVFESYETDYDETSFRKTLDEHGTSEWQRALFNYLEQKGNKTAVWSPLEFSEAFLAVLKTQLGEAEEQVVEKEVNFSLKRTKLIIRMRKLLVEKLLSKLPRKAEFSIELLRGIHPDLPAFFAQNPWAEDYLRNLRKRHGGFRRLVQQYPDEFGDLEKAPYKKASAVLLGIIVFLNKAWLNPKEYPRTVALLERVK